MDYKKCKKCGFKIIRKDLKYNVDKKKWANKKFCSRDCQYAYSRNSFIFKKDVGYIFLSKTILFDKKDLNLISNRTWYISNYNYATSFGGKKMHQEILGGRPTAGKEIDHINHNRLDNRRSNLRIVTREVNRRNRTCTNVNGVTGITKLGKKYRATLHFGKKYFHLGMFTTLQEATKARKDAEIKYWGSNY